VVNGGGTAVASKIEIGNVRMAGKTGTAQVRKLTARNSFGEWKTRDHSLFICYAPTDAPRYAMSVVVEHGTFGARAAAPIARDVITFLYDPETALNTLHGLETAWGGTPQLRMARDYAIYAATRGVAVPPSAPVVGTDSPVSAEARMPAAPPAPPAGAPSPAATPAFGRPAR